MGYSEAALRELEEQLLGLQGNCNELISSYLEREFQNNKAAEFVRHGLCRRLSLMARCIQKVFEVLPPASQAVPGTDEIHDVTVHLHAFVFNAYGCLDNLAHIWVLEKNVKGENGLPIRREWIGFGPGNMVVRASLPDSITDYLSTIENWYQNLENFRHALAHRIPLYVPPGYLTAEQAEEYNEIQMRINEAVGRGEYGAVDQLEDEQATLLSFHPIATHSFDENPKILFFHAQMLSDFHTIRQFATRLLPCLDR